MEAQFWSVRRTWQFFVTVFHLLFIITACTSSQDEDDDHKRCEVALQTWSDQAFEELASLDEGSYNKLKELLYFLHVPRTGGRAYHHCMLRFLYSSEQQCDRSYDILRFNASQHCKLLVSHDDYSILSMLPRHMTSVVTNLRHPVDRVFSAYEFSLEVAARSLLRKDSVGKLLQQKLKSNVRGPSTLSIWPWKFLVPWMQDDLFSRRDERQRRRIPSPSVVTDPYDVPSMAMPLREFIYKPIVLDIVHNGATFQVAGLTNNSYLEGATYLRQCVIDYPDLGHYVLDVAKERLDRMLYVGVTERHKDTSTLFAHVVGRQAIHQSLNRTIRLETQLGNANEKNDSDTLSDVLSNNDSRQPLIGTSVRDETQARLNETSDKLKIDTVNKLIDAYETCSTKIHGNQLSRRRASLKNISPLNFSNEARGRVPHTILEEILQLNNLDLELYRHAESLFLEQQALASNHSISMQNWTKGADVRQLMLEGRKSYISMISSEFTYYIPSIWFGSGIVIFLLVLPVLAGGATIALGWFVSIIIHKGLKNRLGFYHELHKKV